MDKFLQNLIEKNNQKIADLDARMKASNDVEEVRSLGEMKLSLREEIKETEAKLAELNAKGEEERGALNPMASYGLAKDDVRSKESNDDLSTMEYRSAFKDYVQYGKTSDVLQFRNHATGMVVRANASNTLSDLGVLLPTTVVQEIIKGVEQVHGILYSKVRKINVKGGVKFPIGSFDAEFKRISETGAPSDRQKGGSVTGFVEFSYHIGEIRLSQTLLAHVISVPVFEKELAKVIVESYLKAMDAEIIAGSNENGQMDGILMAMESGKITADHIIDFTAEEMKDWKSWQTKLFAKIPLAMRREKAEFVMNVGTYEADIKTLADDNNRPVYHETFNPVDGSEVATFKGKPVTFIDDLASFGDSSNEDTFALYWVPQKAYCINTNLEFTVRKYFDEEKNEYVTKALVINDGKVLDPKYIYVLRKKVTA